MTELCPIIEQTADGTPCGRCWFQLKDSVCPRHGEVDAEWRKFAHTGKCTIENEMRIRKGLPVLRKID